MIFSSIIWEIVELQLRSAFHKTVCYNIRFWQMDVILTKFIEISFP